MSKSVLKWSIDVLVAFLYINQIIFVVVRERRPVSPSMRSCKASHIRRM